MSGRKSLPCFICAAILVLADQLVKAAVRSALAVGEQVLLIPGVLALCHVENTGAAFSSFDSHTIVLAAVSLVMSAVIAVGVWKDFFHSKAAQWAMMLILGGAVGNLIDRAFFRSVTDMIQVLFVRFAVFNVADICVVCGTILLALFVFFSPTEEA